MGKNVIEERKMEQKHDLSRQVRKGLNAKVTSG